MEVKSEYSNSDKTDNGYVNEIYAESLNEFGKPVFLSACHGWVIERAVPNYMAKDAMGCYPLFMCQDWSKLQMDIENKSNNWVSLSIVTDPFGHYSTEYLKECFPDIMFPFKEHFIVDLNKSPQKFIDNHHKRNVRKALQNVKVEICENPLAYLDEWEKLYNILIKKHHITGMSCFSRQAFSKQLNVPGLIAFRTIAENRTVGMVLWYIIGDKAYYHLGAYHQLGYELRASFALFSFAIDYFADLGIRWLSLGAGAGSQQIKEEGLSRFKKGWSTGTRTVFFCGRIFDHNTYNRIVSSKENNPTNYFPAYRFGEF